MGVAWGDESSVQIDGRLLYVLGAVLVAPGEVEHTRGRARHLRPPGRLKAHWYDAGGRSRSHLTAAFGSLPLTGLVVVRSCPPDEPDERRRRKCFETFGPALEQLGCARVVMESRGERADRRDRELVAALRTRRVIDQLWVDHRRGAEEPRLWLADIACGITTSAWRAGTRAPASISVLRVGEP
ncbi:hypothetical protein [Cellulomonas denverensis]|nr:hypothetical protein [Cellulomonas denverensis]GIG24229.1 hypothetical protein Cde04nite_04730 [Cellulomonas denverensis]